MFDAWWNGCLDRHEVVLYLPVYWWGRIGTMLATSAATLVIADIIGRERIGAFGVAIQEQFVGAFRRAGERFMRWLRTRSSGYFRWLPSVFLGALATCVVFSLMGKATLGAWAFAWSANLLVLLVAPFTFALVILAIVFSASLPFRFVAWLLKSARFENFVRLFGLVLVLLGYALVMLTS